MAEKSQEPAEPNAARFYDRPSGSPWGTVALVAVPLLILAPFIFFNGCLLLGAGTQMAIDRSNGPLRLEAAVRVASPDGKTRFEADGDGALRFVQVATERTLQERRILVRDFRRIEAKWRDNRRVVLTCQIRYPAMAFQRECVWDCQTRILKDSLAE